MSRLFIILTLVLVGLLFALPSADSAKAQFYYGGYVVPQSYATNTINYNDGNFYWHPAGPDLAGRNYPAGYYAWLNGNWYLQGVGYLYKETVAQALANKPVDYTPDWQKKLLDIAANRDKVESKLRLRAADYQAFQSGLKALGLQENFHWNNYGQFPGGGFASPHYGTGGSGYGTVTSNVHLGTYGNNGNTLYGYSFNSIKDVYGDTNLNALYQQAARLTQNAQTLAGQATGDFHDLVGEEGQNRARVAEILANAQVARAAIEAAKPQTRTRSESRTFSFKAEEDGKGGTKITPVSPEEAAKQGISQPRGAGLSRQQVFATKCAACHSGADKKGGFDVEAYDHMDLDQKSKVWGRLFTTDKDKIMPRNADGGPGTPLTAAEKKAVVSE